MPQATTKTRQELRSRFVRNAIPTEADFADLIAASLNLADDGLLKLPDQPLSLVRQKADQSVLRFFADSAVEGAAWQMQLIGSEKPGFGLTNQAGMTALFLDGATGNVGIGTRTAGQRLTVEGTWSDAQAIGSELSMAGILAIRSNAPQLDFIDTDANSKDWAIHVNSSKMYFIRSPWVFSDLVLDGTGNVGVGTDNPSTKLHVAGPMRLDDNMSMGSGKEIVFADNGQIRSFDNTHRIMFRRSENIMEFREFGQIMFSAGSENGAEAAKMVVNSNGNVGIGTKTPSQRLTVEGTWSDAQAIGSDLSKAGILAIRSNAPQLDFIDTDANTKDWAIHVNSGKMYFIRSPWESSDLVLDGTGKVGVGTMAPEYKLHVDGTAGITGQLEVLKQSNPILFSSGWTGFASNKKGENNANAEISNDTETFKCLMIAGNKSFGDTINDTEGARKVAIFDDLWIARNLTVSRDLNVVRNLSFARFAVQGFEFELKDGLLTPLNKTKNVYSYTGSDQFLVIPAGVTWIFVKLWGAGGGASRKGGWEWGSDGGGGGHTRGLFPVTPGETLLIKVGRGGTTTSTTQSYGGGGRNLGGNDTFLYGGHGGGYCGIFKGRTDRDPALAIAGGGGGGGASRAWTGNVGGAGGGVSGQRGASPYDGKVAAAGSGGTQTAGGAGGTGTANGANGSGLQGGMGASQSYGGSGGGGYFGGGGGGYSESNTMGGGGGGSGFVSTGGLLTGTYTGHYRNVAYAWDPDLLVPTTVIELPGFGGLNQQNNLDAGVQSGGHALAVVYL